MFSTGDITRWEKYGVPYGAHSYRGTFSTLGLANDVYRIGLYVWENEQTSGFIDTQVKWEKSFSGFHKYESEEIAPISPDDDSPVTFMLSYGNE